MTFDATERAVLAGLADVLIPAGDGFPSASEAGGAGQVLDEVLSVRPDLAAGLKKLLASAKGKPAAEFQHWPNRRGTHRIQWTPIE